MCCKLVDWFQCDGNIVKKGIVLVSTFEFIFLPSRCRTVHRRPGKVMRKNIVNMKMI